MTARRRWARIVARGLLVLPAAAALVLLLADALARHRESEPRAAAAPQRGRFVRAGDVDVFLQETGPVSGEAVVLIHGTGAWSEIWRETLGALGAAGFHAIALDVPPFGFSAKPLGPMAYSRQQQAARFIGVLDAIHVPRATLVGHSIGARPTVEAALRYPERVERLVLVDPALGLAASDGERVVFEQNHPSRLARGLCALRPLRDGAFALSGTNPLLTRRLFAALVSRQEAVTADRVRVLQQPWVVEDTTRGQADWLEYHVLEQDTSASADLASLARLRMPVFAIWGRSDTVTPLWQGQWLAGHIPGARLAVIDGVGHIPYLEDPPAFQQLLIDVLTARVVEFLALEGSGARVSLRSCRPAGSYRRPDQ